MKASEYKEFAVCRLSSVSVFKNANTDAPIITQILFGELVSLLSVKSKKWVRVACDWDELTGWVDPKQLYFIDKKTYNRISGQKHFNLELIYGIISDTVTIPISIGANLHFFDGINVKMPFGKFQFSGQVFSYDASRINVNILMKVAHRFLNAPEMRGGRSIMGIDADGFIQLLFKFMGIDLPRKAMDQALAGEDIGFAEFAHEGDLAFFSKGNKHITHVGMLTGPSSIIHVHGRVKVDKLDQQGIFDLETGRYIYKLRTIKRLFDF